MTLVTRYFKGALPLFLHSFCVDHKQPAQGHDPRLKRYTCGIFSFTCTVNAWWWLNTAFSQVWMARQG